MNPPRPPIEDLDSLPPPALDLLPIGAYGAPYSARRPVASLVTSRGCPYPCIFCDASVVHGRRYRSLSAERVAADVRRLRESLGVREVVFKDSEFTLDRRRAVRFSELMARSGLDVAWSCNSRVDGVDPQLLAAMRAGGCRLIQFGVESGDPAVLEILRKGITIDEVRSAFLWAREAGIETAANIIVGHPGETREAVYATRRLVREIRPAYLSVSYLAPYPGTELDRMARARGWISARALPVTQSVMGLPGAGFLRGRRALPSVGLDTRPPPPRRLMGGGRIRCLFGILAKLARQATTRGSSRSGDIPAPAPDRGRLPMNATAMADGELRRARRSLLLSFYLHPRQIAGRVFTVSPTIWRQNLAAAAVILRG